MNKAVTMFDVVKRLYDLGKYDNDDVAKFVDAGEISIEEYEIITKDYERYKGE